MYYRFGLPYGRAPDTAHRFFARFEIPWARDVRQLTSNDCVLMTPIWIGALA